MYECSDHQCTNCDEPNPVAYSKRKKYNGTSSNNGYHFAYISDTFSCPLYNSRYKIKPLSELQIIF